MDFGQTSPNGAPVWRQEEYTTGDWLADADEFIYTPSWTSPQSRALVTATQMLYYYTSREYPNNTTTYIDSVTGAGTYTNGDVVTIDVDFDPTNSLPAGQGMDHSTYKFIIGHECGHRQSNATGRPLIYDTSGISTNVRCNCDHLDGVYDDMCFQSREKTGMAQSEAWGFFYSSALLNNDAHTTCGMSYWRAMWVGSDPATSTLDETAPVGVSCSGLPKWQIDVDLLH